eukprot:scaffold108184_cov33-Prasinocladus_malaysianus.AAC.1
MPLIYISAGKEKHLNKWFAETPTMTTGTDTAEANGRKVGLADGWGRPHGEPHGDGQDAQPHLLGVAVAGGPPLRGRAARRVGGRGGHRTHKG